MYQNTHFDESMKYITRAPILRAKTKTTCKKQKEKYNHSTVYDQNIDCFTLKKENNM